jgi:TPR repeat protein
LQQESPAIFRKIGKEIQGFGRLLLVISAGQPMLSIMAFISWCRHLFSRAERDTGQKDVQSAAEGGNAEAQFALGLRCCTASGASRDVDQGISWYRKAAEQNHALAQFHLAMMLAGGQGVPRDEPMAFAWTRKAAEGGEAGAQFNLGSRYHRASLDRGRVDSPESRTEAYKWFHLAAAQGYHGSVAAYERVALSMTRDEVLEGNQRVATFVVRKIVQPLGPAAPTTGR